MYAVKCPNCLKERTVQAKKPWMVGDAPYERICRPCAHAGKPKTEDHKRKLSESVKAAQTEELLDNKRQFMIDHPEHWQGKLKQGGAEEHSLGLHHSEETKRKIGDAVKRSKSQGGSNEN